jgi:hypothetical protein
MKGSVPQGVPEGIAGPGRGTAAESKGVSICGTAPSSRYASITPPSLGAEGAQVLRQALAGMLWSKQYYYYDVEMWDEEDGFFYDVLRVPDGNATRLKVRSMVGLLPLCATTVVSRETLQRLPHLLERAQWFLSRNQGLAARMAPPDRVSPSGYHLLSLLDETKLRRVLARLLDETEFLSPYGIRSLSKHHAEHPYTFHLGRDLFRVAYLPAESDTGMFGGNSNWRGPIWMPVNLLLVRALWKLHLYYGDDFKVDCPTGSGRHLSLRDVAQEISQRLASIFLPDAQGQRPVFGNAPVFTSNPHWRDHLLFYEYFHGDTGAGLGASHQTGWTGTVAKLIQQLGAPRDGRRPAPTPTPTTPPPPLSIPPTSP